jgi:hypothetical protein
VVHGLEILVRLRTGVIRAEEIERVFGAGRLGLSDVEGIEPEAFGEASNRPVIRVDQLAAPLGSLAVVEVVHVAEHAAAEAHVRFVDGRRESVIGQLQCARQAGDAAADDRDARRCRGPRETRREQHRGRRARAGEEPATAEAASAFSLGFLQPPVGDRRERDVFLRGDRLVAGHAKQG